MCLNLVMDPVNVLNDFERSTKILLNALRLVTTDTATEANLNLYQRVLQHSDRQQKIAIASLGAVEVSLLLFVRCK